MVNLQMVRSNLLEKQNSEWKTSVNGKPKLRFYVKFKPTMALEKYVSLNLTPSQRSLLAQIRSGTLPLNIKTGRVRNLKVEDRLCNVCSLNAVEDELHFIFECSLYEDDREKFFTDIVREEQEFVYMCLEDQLVVLFSKYPRKLSKFIHSSFNKRKMVLFK